MKRSTVDAIANGGKAPGENSTCSSISWIHSESPFSGIARLYRAGRLPSPLPAVIAGCTVEGIAPTEAP